MPAKVDFKWPPQLQICTHDKICDIITGRKRHMWNNVQPSFPHSREIHQLISMNTVNTLSANPAKSNKYCFDAAAAAAIINYLINRSLTSRHARGLNFVRITAMATWFVALRWNRLISKSAVTLLISLCDINVPHERKLARWLTVFESVLLSDWYSGCMMHDWTAFEFDSSRSTN